MIFGGKVKKGGGGGLGHDYVILLSGGGLVLDDGCLRRGEGIKIAEILITYETIFL